jgi:hypothetical protein
MATVFVAALALAELFCKVPSHVNRCFSWSLDGVSWFLRIAETCSLPVFFLAALAACLPFIFRRPRWWHGILVVPIAIVLTGVVATEILGGTVASTMDEAAVVLIVAVLLLFVGFQMSHLAVHGIDRLSS